jgi:hypothetical protein
MKKRPAFSAAAAKTAAACILTALLLNSMIPIKPAQTGIAPQKRTVVKGVISGQELQQAFTRSGGKKILVTLYVVKRSPRPGGEDIALVHLFSDLNHHPITIGRTWDEARFKTETAWYVDFLQRNHVPKADVLLGYQFAVSKDSLHANPGLEITVYPLEPGGGNVHVTGGLQPIATTLSVRGGGGDTCRYPPGCGGTAILFEKDLAKIMEKAYRK